MYFSDSNGHVVGVRDAQDRKQINLINPEEGCIRIKISTANQYPFYYFVYKHPVTSLPVTIPMKVVLDDGAKTSGDYVYNYEYPS